MVTRIGFVRRSILDRRGQGPWAPLWAGLAIAAPAALRSVLAPWVEGLPFLTFFPAVLIATIFLGWRWGVVVLVGSTLAANYLFQSPGFAFSFRPKEIVGAVGFAVSGGLIVSVAEALRRAVSELEGRTQREASLNLELHHRVNNNLAIIQALARQTARHSKSPDDFYPAFSGRLLAIAEANKVLSHGDWEVARLPELAETALEPFRERGTMTLDGPPCELPTRSCVPLVLALHELATNATKYGALSQPSGCVRLRWSVEAGRCRLVWREQDGPAVAPPTREGLGSRLLRSQPGLETVDLRYPAEGVVCEIVVRGAAASARADR